MSEEQKKAADSQPGEQREVVIKYIKSNLFRVIHADGAWGGMSPHGDIHISFYNERPAIPDRSRFVVSEDQVVKSEEFEAESELVREVEIDVVVDLQTARSLRTWLDGRIVALEELIQKAQEKTIHADKKIATK
jgi:hypothetical protein